MTLLLLQMSIVLLVAVVCGRLARKLGQPRVIGEIIGGILIGPSVFGRFAPHLSADLFPAILPGAARTPLHRRSRPLSLPDRHGTRLRPALPPARHHHGRQRRKHLCALRHGRAARASPAHPLRPARHRQHSLRPVPRHRHEHHRLPGARPHPRGTKPAIDAARHHRHPQRGRQ